MAFDQLGNLFATDGSGIDSIVKIDPSGSSTAFSSAGANLDALGFDSAGDLFAANSVSGRVLKFAPDGTSSIFATGLNQPGSIAFEPVTEKLRNISARGLVGTGDEMPISGFIVGGSALANNAVVVRALGPSLAGVSHALAGSSTRIARRQRSPHRERRRLAGCAKR